MTFTEIAARAGALSTAIVAYYDEANPKHFAKYPFVQPGETDPPPPEEEMLRAFLASLPEDALFGVAFVWRVGQSGLGQEGAAKRYEEIRRSFDGPRDAASRMSNDFGLAEHLEEGFERLRNAGVDPETMSRNAAA